MFIITILQAATQKVFSFGMPGSILLSMLLRRGLADVENILGISANAQNIGRAPVVGIQPKGCGLLETALRKT